MAALGFVSDTDVQAHGKVIATATFVDDVFSRIDLIDLAPFLSHRVLGKNADLTFPPSTCLSLSHAKADSRQDSYGAQSPFSLLEKAGPPAFFSS